MIVETPRLILRELVDDDLDELAAMYADPDVMHFGPGVQTREQTVERLQAWQASYREHGWGMWAVVARERGGFVGQCGLIAQVVDDIDEVEIGYRFKRDAWGHGYATEAAMATRAHAFGPLGMARVISIIEPANARSIRVAEKNGMTVEKETVVWGKRVRIYSVRRGGGVGSVRS